MRARLSVVRGWRLGGVEGDGGGGWDGVWEYGGGGGGGRWGNVRRCGGGVHKGISLVHPPSDKRQRAGCLQLVNLARFHASVPTPPFYYEDPDHNSIELMVDNFGDGWESRNSGVAGIGAVKPDGR